MKACIYARLSKDRQGLSTNVNIQTEESTAYIEAREHTLGAVFSDNDISASKYSTKPRPGYNSLLDAIRDNQVETIVITEVSRLFRNLNEAVPAVALVSSTSWRFVEITNGLTFDLTTAIGLKQFFAAVNDSSYESGNTSERAKRKAAARAKLGQSHGGHRPYGYGIDTDRLNWEGKPILDYNLIREPEAVILREMGRRVIGGHSFRDVADWLNTNNHKTAEGKSWFPITVRNTLMRKRYGGIRVHLGAEYPAVWKPIFDIETWEALQLTIKLRRERAGNQPVARKYLLTGLVYCGKCGKPLNGETKRDKPDRPLRRIYHCRQGCGGVIRNADALECWIKEAVFYRLDSPELAKLLHSDKPADKRLSDLLAKRHVLRLRLDALVDDYASGLLDRGQFARAKATAEAELAKLESSITQNSRKRLASNLIPVNQTLQEAWDSNESDQWRRELIGLLIKEIIVNPGISKPRYYQWRFNPSLINIKWIV